MELAEVINPHFAFPVVGVVLCAVLVFAFGFKSPVQPPSFEFVDEDRKSKKFARNRERSKKPSAQVIVTEHSPKSAATQPSKQPSPNPKQKSTTESASEKSEAVPTKTKKRSTTRSATVKSVVSSQDKSPSAVETQKDEQNENTGEWTAVSKKKQKKSRKESEEGEVSEYVRATSSPEVEAPPLKQRLRKKAPKSQDNDATSVADKENKTPAEVITSVETKIETAKNQKNIKKTKEITQSEEAPVSEPNLVTIPLESTELKAEMEITPLAPTQLNTDTNSSPDKVTKSPKKKNKKTKAEAVEKEAAPSDVTPVIELPPTTENSAPPSTPVITKPEAPKISTEVEESGSWEEAKTVKRKKVKARREN